MNKQQKRNNSVKSSFIHSNLPQIDSLRKNKNMNEKDMLTMLVHQWRKETKVGYPFRMTTALICVPLVVIMFHYFTIIDLLHQCSDSYSAESADHETTIFVEAPQKVSLLQPYRIDYDAVLRIREENMRKYSFDHQMYTIDRRSNLSLQEYRDIYDGKWPVIITDMVPTWEASNWTKDFFNEHYGKERVAMKAVNLPLDAAISEALPIFSELLGHEDSGSSLGTLEKAVSLALPLELFYRHTAQAFPDKWSYVEDELFIPMRPELRRQIGECVFLEEDYFQLFPKEVIPWNAMLLWGTKYSRSSLHMDPYNWTGTNAVITGRKRWLMFPPGQDEYLYIHHNKMSGFPLNCHKYNSPVDGLEPDFEQYSQYKNARAIQFDQLPGELLIIPTGWFHQAYNVEETIAISSQVMNRNNYRVVLEEILKVENLARSSLPASIDDLEPAEQVKTVMSLLPRHILDRGKHVTQGALDEISKPSGSLHEYKLT